MVADELQAPPAPRQPNAFTGTNADSNGSQGKGRHAAQHELGFGRRSDDGRRRAAAWAASKAGLRAECKAEWMEESAREPAQESASV